MLDLHLRTVSTRSVVACIAIWTALGAPGAAVAEGDPIPEPPIELEGEAAVWEAGAERAGQEELPAKPPLVIEEIRVTVERRETDVQDTPIAVSVFDMEMLDTAGTQDIQGLAYGVPNFHYGEVLGAASVTIRGIATLGGDQATAMHIDGIYQDNPYTVSGISFYDLDRVEVLRGPQGTLYGRNATGGVINVITRPPSFAFETAADAQVGSYHEIRVRSMLNVPIVDDLLALRLSGVFNRRYGYTELLTTNVRNDDLDDDRSWALRSQLRLQPNENIDWITRFTVMQDRSNGLGLKLDGDYPDSVQLLPLPLLPTDIYVNASHPNPSDPRKVYFDTRTKNDRDLYMANTTFKWFLDDLAFLGESALTVAAGYQRSVQSGIGDVDLSDAFSRGLPGGAYAGPFPMLETELDGTLSEVVAEANLDVHTPLDSDWMSLRWMIGVFYLETRSRLDAFSDISFELGVDTMGPLLAQGSAPSVSKARARSAAGFVNLDWTLWDQLTVFGGVRYSWDWKKGSVESPEVALILPDYGLPSACLVPEFDDTTAHSWSGVTGRLGAEWQFTADNMVYGQFSTGYKAGALNPLIGELGCASVDEIPDADPESVLAWELGSKNQLFDSRLQLNVTGFAYLYHDIQVTTLVENSLVTDNANAARILGAELELVALPFASLSPGLFTIDTLTLTLLFGYTNAIYTDYPNGILVEDPLTPQDWTGNQLPLAPEYTFTIQLQYDQELGRFGTLTPFLRYFYSDQLYFRAANRPRDLQESFQFFDASLAWRDSSRRFTVEAFVNNALDEDVVSRKLVHSVLVGSPTVSAYYPPRTWGVRAGFAW